MNVAKPYYFGIVLLSIMLMASCSSSTKQKQKGAAGDSLVHDPYSAPLHKASNSALASDFKTSLLDGSTFQLSAQKGKVVLLNIWATWCPPCQEETPDLEEVYQQYKPQGVTFLGISVDKQGRSVVEPFVKKHDVTYPITIDDGRIMKKYGPVMGYPTTYLVGADGNLRYFATGAITKKELQPRLDKLIAEEKK